MTPARIFTPENRLAKALSSLDGATAEELVLNASARVAKLEVAIRAYVSEQLLAITEFAAEGEDVLFAECRTLSELARNVAEVAGAGGLDDIGEVASGINAMVENLHSSGVWHTDALRLHLDALALLNQRVGANTGDGEFVLARLRNMRQAIGVAE